MITLRLDPSTERNITRIAKIQGISRSELIRRSINELIDNFEKPSAWELGSQVFGKYASGQGNLSTKRKQLIKEKIKAKR